MYTKTRFFLISFCFLSIHCFCQNTFIPDDNFEQALINLGLDTLPLDDFVPTANINSLTSLDLNFNVTGLLISDLTGIEDFAALTQLFVQNNQLPSIDVSLNSNLEILWCFNNQLASLDVTQNPDLISLRCEDNQLTNLNTSKNSGLNILIFENNQITSIDVSNNTGLRRLQCGNNLLSNLNVGSNTNLSYLSCELNQLPSLDVANNNDLTTLICFNNLLTTLNLSQNSNLTILECSNNNLCSLNLKNGNNNNIVLMDFDSNPNLSCVVIDNINDNRTSWEPISFSNYAESQNACRNFIPIDTLANVIGTSYTLPTLNNGNYFTETSGMGTALNTGDIITSTQTIYIYNETTCNSNESSFIVVINNEDYFIPKYFTPNNDGANDVWQVYDRLNFVNNISIYNRYGKLLKFLPSTTSSWDGTFNGKVLISDTYWYEIILNTREVLRGPFVLKR